MRILIIGSNSQISLHLKKLIPRTWQVLTTTKNELDIRIKNNIIFLVKNFKPNVIINTAAYNLVDQAQNNQLQAFLINHQAVANIAKIANTYNAFVITFSTAYVFDGNNKIYYEDDKPNPINIYGRSKLAGEKVALHNPNTLIIRTSAIFSEFNTNFVKKILTQANPNNYKIVNDTYTAPTYAQNIANLIIFILKKYQFSLNGILHYNGETNINWYEFSKLIFKIAYLNKYINKIPDIEPIQYKSYSFKTPRPKYSILSREKIISLGFNNELTLEASITKTIKDLYVN